MRVDPHGARLHAGGVRGGLGRVARPHRRAETHLGGVGPGEGVVEVGVADHREDGAELLLVDQGDAVGDVGDDRGAVEQLAEFRGCFTSGDDAAAVRDGIVDEVRDDVELVFVLHRAEHVLLVEARTHRGLLGDLGERGDHVVVDRVVHVQALHRGARLARVDERAPEQVLRDGLRVGAGQHDRRVVAAELERQAGEVAGGCLDDLAPGLGRAGEHHLGDVGVPGEASPDGARPCDRHENVGGQHVIDDRGERQHAEGGVAAGLEHGGVPHAQRRPDLPDRDHQRPVPRADRTDDARGLVDQLGVQVLVVDEHLRLEHRGGVGAQPGRARTDLEAGVGAVQRLALFAREQAGQWFGVRVDRVGGGDQQARALFVAERLPAGLRGLGTGDRGVEVVGALHGHATDDLAGGGVEDLAPLPLGCLHTGEQRLLIEHGRGGGHRCLLRRRCPAPQRGPLIFSGGRAARIVGACAGVAHRRTDALVLRLGGGARPGVASPLVRFT